MKNGSELSRRKIVRRQSLSNDLQLKVRPNGHATGSIGVRSTNDDRKSVLGLDTKDLYNAVLSRDRRFDGRMFVGVKSTRIYCRPICTVRPPRFENCMFYRTAAAAEAIGYRPCLRCRPELAPGSSSAPVDAIPRLAALAVRRIEDGALSVLSLDELATEFGVSGRHLRRAIGQEVGLSPVALAQTQRLLLAKQLLTDTKMTVTETAFAAGFESLRRFNAAFKARYRLTPTSLRRSANANNANVDDAYSFGVAVRPPFNLQPLLAFCEARAIPGVEQVADGWYRRTVAIFHHKGWVAIGPGQKEHTIQILISKELGPVLPMVLARLKAMCDVRADPATVADHFSRDPLLGPLIKQFAGTRVPSTFHGFECGIRAILGQQISVRAATTIAGRFAARFGETSSTPYSGLTTTFPVAESLATAKLVDIQSLGLTNRRAETIQRFAIAVAEGHVHLEPGADPERVRAALLAISGIGDWTVEYLLLRAVGWPDAFPASDLGLVKASGLSPAELRNRAEDWRPWRSYAAILLWQSLGATTNPQLKKGRK